MIDSIIHRFTGMSSVVFSPLYHYQYSFSYLYFEVILYAAHHIMLYHYQHIPVYPYSDVTPYTARPPGTVPGTGKTTEGAGCALGKNDRNVKRSKSCVLLFY